MAANDSVKSADNTTALREKRSAEPGIICQQKENEVSI